VRGARHECGPGRRPAGCPEPDPPLICALAEAIVKWCGVGAATTGEGRDELIHCRRGERRSPCVVRRCIVDARAARVDGKDALIVKCNFATTRWSHNGRQSGCRPSCWTSPPMPTEFGARPSHFVLVSHFLVGRHGTFEPTMPSAQRERPRPPRAHGLDSTRASRRAPCSAVGEPGTEVVPARRRRS
jgi:hypothetical protein